MEAGWVAIQNSERAQRFEHRVTRRLKLTTQQHAILAVLLLRRPQTLNEIKTRTERMAEFTSTDEIRDILDTWLTDEQPLVMRLAAGQGRREDRYYHTLGTETAADLQDEIPSASMATPARHDDVYEALEARIMALEQRLTALEAHLGE